MLFQFVDLDFRGQNLGAFDTRLELDATLLWDVRENEERRFGETESFQQLRELYLEQPLSRGYTVAVGRRIITESGNAWVDGALSFATRRISD